MLYNPPSGSSDANAPYVPKNVAAGTQGSKVPPAAVEYTQREVVAAIAASGQAPTNTVLVQAAMALARGVFVGKLTGTGDLAVATLGVVFPSLLQGMRIGAVALAPNTTTSPKLRVVNLGSTGGFVDFPILKEDGTALAVGEIKADRRYRFEADGAGNVAISGGGLGNGVAAIQQLLQQFVVLTDQKTNGTPGGVFTAGAWRTRDLNTIVADPQSLAAGGSPTIGLSGNNITLQPGTYVVEGSAPALTVDTHKVRFQNVTDGLTAIWGTAENTTGSTSTTPDTISTRSYLQGTVTLTAAKTFQLQHICSTTSTGASSGAYGFGCPSTYGLGSQDGPETYSVLKITKVG